MNESIFDVSCFEKIQNDLCNESKNIRKNGLEKLLEILTCSGFKSELVDKSEIFSTVIKLFADKSEACRERAVKLIQNCVNEWDLAEDDVMYRLIPVIHKRLVKGTETESSEEVRLCFIKLIKLIISKFGHILSPHLTDVVDILICCICDEYPEVKKEGCECASDLAVKVPEYRLHSEAIIKAVLKVLKHKHARIRIAAITSLRNIVQFGHPGAIESIHGDLGECLLEQNPHVRMSVLKTAAFWFMEYRDRYSYARFLLPLVLTELTDETQENRREAENLWDQIGLQYLKEHEDDLKEKNEFLPKELEHYPGHVKRSNLGCRTIVQNEMMKIIPTLMHELQDWKSDVRIKSSELLKIIVLHGEARIISFLEIALPVMSKACIDEESRVGENVIETAEMMGYFITTDKYWPFMMNLIRESQSSGRYKILAALLKHNYEASLSQQIKGIVADLVDSELFETTEEQSLRNLLEIMSKLIKCLKGQNVNEETVREIYLMLISVMAFGNDKTQDEAAELVESLAEATSSSSVSDLNDKCLLEIFARLESSAELWESYSRDFNIFIILLSKYADDIFRLLPDKLLDLLERALDMKKDREVIFKTLHTLGKLFEKEKWLSEENLRLMEKIILGPLKIQLVWKAGQVLEVVRCTALGIVLLFVQKSTTFSSNFIPNIHPLVLSLCEDSYCDTRIYSLQILPFIGRNEMGIIEKDIFVKSFRVATERLNDRNNAVRCTAAKVIKDLLLRAPNLSEYEKESRSDVLSGLKQIFINADEKEKRIQDAILDIMKETQITENMKSILPERDMNILIKRYRHSNISNLLKEYLNI